MCEMLWGKQKRTVSYSFQIMTDPGQPILKNCLKHATEGENVTCECSSERDGEPRPVLSWLGQTNSSILHLYDVRITETYMCEMTWGEQKRMVSYILQIITNKDGSYKHTAPSSLVQIIGMVVAAVFFLIIVIIIIMTAIIKMKRYVQTPLNPKVNELELVENIYYGGLKSDNMRESGLIDNDRVDSRNSEQTIQSDVEKDEGREAQADLYAVVEKNKEKEEVKAELYAAVMKSSVKQQEPSPGRRINIVSEVDVYAVVEKGAEQETYAQVVKLSEQ
ncbi:uncharacterized protein LOC112568682 isoform X2 [Pomacea canaliculata]|uniref:uncharacterized protein LOC112568682 isoform X2 n=1 Tax=Pomacea canaliculata TaxID=400727 RepID=UPI000D738C72|nr:uncharacterized protein LOC112568682 isoform X2 [Pomacea canaliculata]